MGNVAALFSDTKRREAETRRRDASQIALVRLPHVAAIPHQARLRVRLLPKKEKIGLLQFFEESVVACGERRVGRRRGRMGCLRPAADAKQKNFPGRTKEQK